MSRKLPGKLLSRYGPGHKALSHTKLESRNQCCPTLALPPTFLAHLHTLLQRCTVATVHWYDYDRTLTAHSTVT